MHYPPPQREVPDMPLLPPRRLVVVALLITSGIAAGAAALFAASTQGGGVPATLPPAVMTAGKGIDPARLEAHVRALADDRMEGRGTGTRGYDMAAQYVAEQMQSIGLMPGGVGGYLQPVPFLRAQL